MAAESTTGEEPGLLGYISLLVIIAIIASGSYAVYSKYLRAPAPVISLSAYFTDNLVTPNDTNLKIRGEVHLAGQPLKEGSVRLTVSRQEGSFQQSVSADLKNGLFEIEDPAFRALHPADQIHIKAEVLSSQLSESATDEIYLNTGPPSLPLAGQIALWGVILALIGIFLFAFTGKKTPWKNRTAIILSYCIIGITLAVPLLAPVFLLRAFPRARCAMNAAPVGLVVTPIGKDPDVHTQWALNIGGYSTPKLADSADTSGNSPTGGEKNTAKTETTPGAPQETTNTHNTTGTAQTLQDSSQRTPSNSSPHSTDKPNGPGASAVDTTDAHIASRDRGALKEADCSDVVTVEGGLVIPLYVIILSVIGGAINMTRKVPRFQREGEYTEVSLPPMGSLFSFRRRTKSGPIHGELSSKVETQGVDKGTARNNGAPGQDLAPKVDTATDIGAHTTVDQKATDQPEAARPSIPKRLPPVPAGDQKVLTSAEADTEKEDEDASAEVQRKPTDQQSLKAKANDIDTQLDHLVKEQVQRNTDTDGAMSSVRDLVHQMRDLFDSRKDDGRLLGFESFEDWLGSRVNLRELLGSNWRVELLNQYMYLISAPFLAIVAYYMLDLLGVVSKQPIVVLISFSVGLISERIVSWILGVATGYLRSDVSTQAAGK